MSEMEPEMTNNEIEKHLVELDVPKVIINDFLENKDLTGLIDDLTYLQIRDLPFDHREIESIRDKFKKKYKISDDVFNKLLNHFKIKGKNCPNMSMCLWDKKGVMKSDQGTSGGSNRKKRKSYKKRKSKSKKRRKSKSKKRRKYKKTKRRRY